MIQPGGFDVKGVVHVFGGIHDYLGTIEQVQGEAQGKWVKLSKPCLISAQADGNRTRINVILLGGPEYAYKHYVWLWFPNDSLIEVREVDPESSLMEIYKKQIETKRYTGDILVPGTPAFEKSRPAIVKNDKNKFRPLKH